MELGWTAVGADHLNDTCRDPNGEWCELPFFTSSLDAKVTDENIIISRREFRGKQTRTHWMAFHFVEGSGESLMGNHPTSEASARRPAAMRARARAMEKADA